MAQHRVKVGDTSDANFTGNVDGIIAALKAGHRHLVFTSPNIEFDKTLDLDDATIRSKGNLFANCLGTAIVREQNDSPTGC